MRYTLIRAPECDICNTRKNKAVEVVVEENAGELFTCTICSDCLIYLYNILEKEK